MNFTERMGISVPQEDITIRWDAPSELRGYIFILMKEYESLKKIRNIVCLAAKVAENPNNWKENEYMDKEIQEIMDKCLWNRIYDIIEDFYSKLLVNKKRDFEKKVNEYFIEKGIGWKLQNGKLETRGDDIFEGEIKQAKCKLEENGLMTSQNEIKEAITDLSMRPKPDITGAIQHALAALECVCREITGDNATLGTLIINHSGIIPRPLDDAIRKIWGFSSERGRHLKEGGEPSYEEAELVVHLTASLCVYLMSKLEVTKQPTGYSSQGTY